MINYIKEKNAFDLMEEKLKQTAEYRVKYTETSLMDLNKIMTLELETNISKSCLNHRLRKIKEFYEKIKNQEEK